MNPSPAPPRDVQPLESLGDLARGWDRFWFSPADPTTLGLIRLCAGLVVFYSTWCYSFDLLSYVSPTEAWLDGPTIAEIRNKSGVLAMPDQFPDAENHLTPMIRLGEGQTSFSIFFHLSDPASIWTAHVVILVVMFLFAVGWATRVTSVLALLGFLCYVHRAPTSLFGMDSILAVLLFYLMLAPSGAAVSVDRLLEVWRARRRRGDPNFVVPLRPSVSANFITRMMQVHFCMIYLAAGTCKLLGAAWWNGTALWMCYANYSFAPLRVPVYRETLRFICQHRWLWELVMSGGAAFTIALELSFTYLVWHKRWRWFMLCCSVMLHTGIGLFMGLVTFSLAMLCLVLSFVPPETTQLFLAGVVERLKKVRAALYGAPTPAGATPAPAR